MKVVVCVLAGDLHCPSSIYSQDTLCTRMYREVRKAREDQPPAISSKLRLKNKTRELDKGKREEGGVNNEAAIEAESDLSSHRL